MASESKAHTFNLTQLWRCQFFAIRLGSSRFVTKVLGSLSYAFWQFLQQVLKKSRHLISQTLCTIVCYQLPSSSKIQGVHDDVIKWKHFPRYWPFVRGIHRSPVNSTHKGQWRGALMFTLICARINGWVNNREAGDLRCYRAHYDVIVMDGYESCHLPLTVKMMTSWVTGVLASVNASPASP